MPRVLIVDDQPGFRSQLRALLDCAGMMVVGEAGDIAEAAVQARNLQPDLAIVDLVLPGCNGLEGIPQLKAIAPRLRVILVSAYRDQAQLLKKAALAAGAEAFVSKDELDLELARAWDPPR